MRKTPSDKPARPPRLPGDNPLNLDNMLKREVSPLNDRVWRLVLKMGAAVAVGGILALIGLSYYAAGH